MKLAESEDGGGRGPSFKFFTAVAGEGETPPPQFTHAARLLCRWLVRDAYHSLLALARVAGTDQETPDVREQGERDLAWILGESDGEGNPPVSFEAACYVVGRDADAVRYGIKLRLREAYRNRGRPPMPRKVR